MNNFASAMLKLERADHHIREMRSEFDKFGATRPYTFRQDLRGAFIPVFLTIDRSLPLSLTPLLGDAAHNLRSALDHFVWQAVPDKSQFTSRQIKLIQFPNGAETPDHAESQLITINLPKKLHNFIHKLGVYKGGPSEDLVKLSAIDIDDKHKAVSPVFGRCRIPVARLIYNCYGGKEAAIEFEAQDYTFPINPDFRPATHFGSHYGVVRLGDFDRRLGRPTGEMRLTDDQSVDLTITFDSNSAFAGEPIFSTMNRLSKKVRNVLMLAGAADF